MENNTSPPNQNEFKRPVNIFEAIAQNSENNNAEQDKQKKADKPTTKEKSKGDFLFPIGMLF